MSGGGAGALYRDPLPSEETNRLDWKHYLPLTSLVGGKYERLMKNKWYHNKPELIAVNLFAVRRNVFQTICICILIELLPLCTHSISLQESYGIFLDTLAANILLDHFIKEHLYTGNVWFWLTKTNQFNLSEGGKNEQWYCLPLALGCGMFINWNTNVSLINDTTNEKQRSALTVHG